MRSFPGPSLHPWKASHRGCSVPGSHRRTALACSQDGAVLPVRALPISRQPAASLLPCTAGAESMLLPFSRRPEGNGLALGRFSVIYATPPCVITRRSPVQGSRAVPEHLCLIRPYVPKARTLRSQPPRPPAPRRKLPRGRVLDCPPPRQHGSARRSRAPGNGGSAAQIFTPLRRHPGAPTTV